VVDPDRLLPIFSCYTGAEFADLPFPLMQDYGLQLEEEESSEDDFFRAFERRGAPKAIFRGSLTGCGSTPETNPRLRLYNLVHKELNEAVSKRLFDVGITRVSARLRKHPRDSFIQCGVSQEVDLVPFMTLQEQRMRCRFAICVEGHSAASRMGALLRLGFVVLLVDPPVSAPAGDLFFTPQLVDGVHVVRCSVDLSLVEVVERLARDTQLSARIAWNGLQFYRTHLTSVGIEKYIAAQLE
jgi:hypothetical protein